MNSDTHNSRAALLGELESLKHLLNGDSDTITESADKSAASEPDSTAPGALPGQQNLFDRPPIDQPQTLSALALATPADASGAPLEEPEAPESEPLATASSENPFLPEHMRTRLNTERPLLEAIRQAVTNGAGEQAGGPLANLELANLRLTNPELANPELANPELANPKMANPDLQPAAAQPLSEATISAYVDEIVQQWLPKIESDLRQRLRQSLQQPEAPAVKK
ncbi:hypothetical protein G8764_20180 [Pseudomaricurvus alcaniphilus]|uniref:hypothetical protein n=1 Tax=Pseudomaricurvus alcaniphilus TaxID=1166482 RepID=UPI00140C4371|nr:hypothetical protein [Pseudomaricurvus alcaniphilus]NHN39625.1 hypothetical protein [Pseudomaricurvus alcaniphilus]